MWLVTFVLVLVDPDLGDDAWHSYLAWTFLSLATCSTAAANLLFECRIIWNMENIRQCYPSLAMPSADNYNIPWGSGTRGLGTNVVPCHRDGWGLHAGYCVLHLLHPMQAGREGEEGMSQMNFASKSTDVQQKLVLKVPYQAKAINSSLPVLWLCIFLFPYLMRRRTPSYLCNLSAPKPLSQTPWEVRICLRIHGNGKQTHVCKE